DSERIDGPPTGLRTHGRTRSRCRLIRERVPVRARSSRARARKRAPSGGTSATVTPVPAHASSAMACSVSRAWQTRQARPVASSSSVVAERSRTTAHSSATSPGSLVPSPSTQAHQPALASAIARYQSGISEAGQLAPSGGETANRYASERSRTTSVNAKRSGAHSSSSSPSWRPAISCHSDPTVGPPPAESRELLSRSIATFHTTTDQIAPADLKTTTARVQRPTLRRREGGPAPAGRFAPKPSRRVGAMPDNEADLSSPSGPASGDSRVSARRVLEPLGQAESMELLADGGLGRLVFTSRYGPTAVPVVYKVDRGSL